MCVSFDPPPPHGDELPLYQCTPVVIHTSITIGVDLALVPRSLCWLKLSLNHSAWLHYGQSYSDLMSSCPVMHSVISLWDEWYAYLMALCHSLCRLMTFCFFGMEDMGEKVARKQICTADNNQNIFIPNTAVQYIYFALLLLFSFFFLSVKYWIYQISCHLRNVWSAFSCCMLLLQGCSILFLEIYRPLDF